MKLLVSQTRMFEKEIARLNKKAARVGFSPLTFTNLGRKTVTQTRIVVEHIDDEEREHRAFVPVEVTEYELVLPSADEYRWTLLGKLERLEDGSTFVDSRVKGLDLAKWAAANPCHCDHCHTARNRNFTYIIRNVDDAREMQVGRNCFADYIGQDGLLKLEFLSLVVSMFSQGEDEFWPGEQGGSRRMPVVNARRVIAAAEWMFRQSGWKYNQKDDYGQLIAEGTHRQAAHAATAPTPVDNFDKPLTNGIWGMFQDANDPAWAAADAIIERLKNYDAPADDEFAQALVYAVNFELLPERKASLIAYAGQFLRNVDEKARLEARKATAQHIGTVGAREVFELTCTGATTREGDFGTTYITRFEDQSGNPVTWFASKSVANEGETLKIKATVKEHGEFRGCKQTIITRGKVVE